MLVPRALGFYPQYSVSNIFLARRSGPKYPATLQQSRVDDVCCADRCPLCTIGIYIINIYICICYIIVFHADCANLSSLHFDCSLDMDEMI